MEYSQIIFIAVLGLVFGSFLSVIVSRLDNKEGIVTGRSECPKCLTKLKWYDLIPLLSFFTLAGKCRYCKVKISLIYPVMELVTALAFSSYCLISGPCLSLSGLYYLTMIFFLLVLFFFDYTYYILPDKIIFSGLAVAAIYTGLFHREILLGNILTGLVLCLFFAIIYIISHGEWIGFGDAKLALLIGFILGYPIAVWSILFSIWTGAIWGMALMAVGRATVKTALPFGSFMGAVAIIFIILNNYHGFLSQYLF